MTKWQRFGFTVFILFLCSFSAQGETRYVTDRVLVGMHQNPSESSPLVKSVPSGTELEVLDRDSGFTRVKTADGIEGWVNSQYLVPQQPAVALLDAAERQLKKAQEELKATQEKNRKNERETQVVRDELANAQATIKELKNKQKTAPSKKDDKSSEKLAAANKQVEQLKSELSDLQKQLVEAKETPAPAPEKKETETEGVSIVQLEQENRQLRARIEVALANLEGKNIPSSEELAALHPRFPAWYWGLILTVLVLGFIGGLIFLDIQHRRRHGGFRL